MAEPLNKEPVYLSIRRYLNRQIESGAYAVGSALPSENELAERFSTTRLTVRNAMEELVCCGAVRRVQGKGAYVTGVSDGAERVDGFRESVMAEGKTPSVRVLSKSKRYAGPFYAHIFELHESELLYAVRRLNSIDGKPVSVETTFIPLALFPDIEEVDISVFSLYETYEMLGHKPAKAIEKLDIEALGARDAGLLNLEAGDLALLMECISFNKHGRAIEYAKSFNRGDAGGYVYTF